MSVNLTSNAWVEQVRDVLFDRGFKNLRVVPGLTGGFRLAAEKGGRTVVTDPIDLPISHSSRQIIERCCEAVEELMLSDRPAARYIKA